MSVTATIDYIIERGLDGELTKKDYYKVKQLYSILENEEVKEKVNLMLNDIYHTGILNRFSSINVSYINHKSYLLPLVLVNYNKKIKFTASFNFHLNCPFHIDEKPSFVIDDYKNYGYCYGCGLQVTSISYLEYKEHINFNRAVELLSRIYLYSLDGYKFNDSDLAKKYQQVLLSEEYQDLLERANQKRIEKGLYTDKLRDAYDERMSTILRINNNEYDPNFKFDKPKTKVKIDLTKYRL